MDTETKIDLITRDVEEIVTEEELKNLVKKKKTPIAYVGYAPTGKLHIGYFVPILKIRDLLNAGIKVKFLIADLHAHLDDLKTPWELLDARSKYYEEGIKLMLSSIGSKTEKVEFIRGSSFQYEKDYVEDIFRLAAIVTMKRSRRAAAEVVRFGKEPKVGGFIYPLMQCEDVPALNVDIVFGGIDQRGPYMLAREILPEIGHKKPICIFTPLISGLIGEKMSASVEKSKIDLLDSREVVDKKINEAFCPAAKIEGNSILGLIKHIVVPVTKEFVIKRPEKYGGTLKYKDYSLLEKDFIAGKIHPADLKSAVAIEINKLLDHIRNGLNKELVTKAYQ